MTGEAHPQLPNSADVNSYVYDFSEKVWTPDAAVALCHVPWDSSYRDVARFATDAAKNSYFNGLRNSGQSVRLTGLTILKFMEPVIIPIPFNTACAYNYLIVDADSYPVTRQNPTAQDTYYYFIQDMEYLAPNATKVWVQLDVWQTFYERVTFNRCYVERGHIGIANENATTDNLTDYMMIPEGLDYGNEYEIQHQQFWNFVDEQPYVVVVSTTDLAADAGTVENPNLTTATGGIYDHIPNGCNVYAFSGTAFTQLMQALSDKPWISQGIIMLTIIPSMLLNIDTPISVQGVTGFSLEGVATDDIERYVISDFWSKFNYPSRYQRLIKFLTSPYSIVEATSLTGGEIVFKPECFGVDKAFRVYSVVSPPHIRAMVCPEKYNTKNNNGETFIFANTKDVENTSLQATFEAGEGLDMAIQLGNFPQLTLVNNQYINYLASTAHTRAFQFESAEWSYIKASAGANLAYNQGTNAMAIRQNATNLAIGAIQDRGRVTQLATLARGAGGVVAGAMNGAAGSAVNSAVNAGVSFAQTEASMAISSALAQGQTSNINTGAAYNRDTNKDYADFANKGDYQNTVHQIQAKIQDARLTQPSTIGQNGGEVFNWANGMVGILFKFKRIKDQFVTTIGEYWFRYGYYVNVFLVPPANLACCTKFTYWKMHEIYLSAGNVPEVYKNAIRGIFQKGVTVWTNPDEIGVIDPADNLPLEGVSY